MERFVLKELVEWKNAKNRKPPTIKTYNSVDRSYFKEAAKILDKTPMTM